jgi:hypothetical protein
MYQEITEEDLERRLTLVDKFLNSGVFNAKELLNYVHTLFPLDILMSEEFKGTHSILLKDGKLQLLVWCNDRAFAVIED